MVRIGIIGSGNVAFHIWRQLKASNQVHTVNIWSPNINNKPEFELANVTPVNYMENDDIVIIATKDDVIEEVQEIIPVGPIVVHTSGFTSQSILQKHQKKGVLYPLQTFSKKTEIQWSKVPLFIESDTTSVLAEIKKVAEILSPNVQIVTEEQRKKLHVDGVFVNNFVNYLLSIVENHCQKNGIDKSVFNPLLEETIRKYQSLPAKDAQTGPALRNDQATIKGHLELLEGKEKEVYQLLTKAIHEKFNHDV